MRRIKNQIEPHLQETQYGFRKHRSTGDAIHAIRRLMDYAEITGKEAFFLFLDWEKAFDKVDHNILISKLYALGIRGKVLTWLTAFLKNRKQRVKVDGCLSSPQWVLSGVPQGSVLGPLLFIIMMIDIDKGITAGLASFADDTKLWEGSPRHDILQDDLRKVYEWIESNNLSANGGKFEHLHFGKHGQYQLYLDDEDQLIQSKKSVKDLGVHVSCDLKFEVHINTIVRKAQKLSSWILRTFRTRAFFPMLILLKTLVVPAVEYACVVWSPTKASQIDLVESIQEKFTERFQQFREYNEEMGTYTCGTHYWDRLRKLKIYSLERRRERYLILFLYKVLIKEYPNPGFDLPITTMTPRKGITVRPKTNPHAPDWVQTIRGASFFNKAPHLFNTLPTELRHHRFFQDPTLETVVAFKNGEDKYLSTVPDQPGKQVQSHGGTRQALTNSIIHQNAYKSAVPGGVYVQDPPQN